MHSRVVVLPAPFGPSSPKTSPALTSKLTPQIASVSSYRFHKPETETAAADDSLDLSSLFMWSEYGWRLSALLFPQNSTAISECRDRSGILSGRDGRPAIGGSADKSIDDAPRFRLTSCHTRVSIACIVVNCHCAIHTDRLIQGDRSRTMKCWRPSRFRMATRICDHVVFHGSRHVAPTVRPSILRIGCRREAPATARLLWEV
jgi:hypothetical protein